MPTYDPTTGTFQPDVAPMECEYTAPGSTTEAMDCKAEPTHRLVSSSDVTTGLFCDDHLPQPGTGERLEELAVTVEAQD